MTSSPRPITRLRPHRGWRGINLLELIRFRQLIGAFATRDVKLRYKQTLLGVAWVIVQPLFAAGIFAFVFGVVAGMKTSSGGSYIVFSFAGLLIWNVFGSTLTRAGLSMVGNTQLVTKVYFPRLILPLSTTAAALIDFAVPFTFLLAGLVAFGQPVGWPVLLVPIWVGLALVLALGIGLTAAALTIDYRDMQYVLPLLTPFLLYASPVAYDVARIPARYQTWYHLLNPMTSVIEAFRWSVMGTPLPPAWCLAYSVIAGLVLFVGGAFVFRQTERLVADVI